MRLNNQMNPSDDELISRIKAGLQDYEEPYVSGSWENFNHGRKHKKGLGFRLKALSSAAAVLLIGVGVFLHIDGTAIKKPVQIVKVKDNKHQKVKGNLGANNDISGTLVEVLTNKKESTAIINTLQKANNSKISHSRNRTGNTAEGLTIIDFEVASTKLPEQIKSKTDTHPAMPDSRLIARTPVTGEEASDGNKKIAFEDFLAAENKSADPVVQESETRDKKNKWDLGLVVSPSYGNTKKITMGYGMSMAYKLNDKIGLSSGISISEMVASRDFVQPETMATLNGRVLESAESTVTGIDIPLDIKYHFGRNVYANLGVSAFAVVDQSRENTFVEAKLVERSFNTAEGKQETRTFVESQRTIEKVQNADLKSSKYLGLYNFSFGFKQKVSKTTSLSIEPFVKAPFKESKGERLKLSATGIRFKLEI